MYRLTVAFEDYLKDGSIENDIANYVGWRPYERTIGPSADSLQRMTFLVEGDFIEVRVLLDGLYETQSIHSHRVEGVARCNKNQLFQLHSMANQ